MDRHNSDATQEQGCGCGCNRREFLASAALATGLTACATMGSTGAPVGTTSTIQKEGASVRVAFLYPPSQTFADNPDGWWSWPGNEYDAEGRQVAYTTALRRMEQKMGMKLIIDETPIANDADANRLAQDMDANPPDGLLIVMFYNGSLAQADLLLAAADTSGIPVLFFIGLGVKHGSVTTYRRPGVYFIQALDDLNAIENGLRMINAKKIMSQSRLLSITEADEPREGVEGFFGTTVRVIPFSRYAEEFERVTINRDTQRWIDTIARNAREVRGITQEAFDNAARAHFALKKMLVDEQADGVTMNCLRRGMLKPCISFSSLNSQLIPAACENDLPAVYTQLLGQLLTGRPGFQHNPCFETERNHYYASHCTCASNLKGPDEKANPYLLRRFAHTNEGSCAIQVFWSPGDPVTMARYYPGEEPALDIYAGRVIESHPMPPAAGCTTNVEIELTDRTDAMMVSGHHNLLFVGDFARRFRVFAQLYKMRLAKTGFEGQWPV